MPLGIPVPFPNLPVPIPISPIRTLNSFLPPQVRNFVQFTAVSSFNLAQFAAHVPSQNWSAAPPPLLADIKRQTARGFIMDANFDPGLGTGHQTLKFQYNPEEVSIDIEPNYVITPMPGRSHPFVQWVGSGVHKISFSLKFWYTQQNVSGVGNVADCVNWIQSFLLPQQDNNGQFAIAPKTVYLYLGNTIATDTYRMAHALLLKAPVRYAKLWEPSTLSPRFAEMQLEFMALLQNNQDNEYFFDRQTTFGAKELQSPLNPLNSTSQTDTDDMSI